MVTKVSVILIIILLITNCKDQDKIIKQSFDNNALIYYSKVNKLYCLDSGKKKNQLVLNFNHLISYAGSDYTGNHFIINEGQGSGVFSDNIDIYDKHLNFKKTFHVLDNPVTVKLFEDLMIVFNKSYYENGCIGLQVFNVQTGQKLFENKSIPNLVFSRNCHIFNNQLYFSVSSNSNLGVRKGRVFSLDLRNYQIDDISKWTKTAEGDLIDIFVKDDKIYIINLKQLEIQIFSLKTKKIMKKLEISKSLSLPNIAGSTGHEVLLTNPIRIKDHLVLQIIDYSDQFKIFNFLSLNTETDEFSIASIDSHMDFGSTRINLYDQNHLFLEKENILYTINPLTGKIEWSAPLN